MRVPKVKIPVTRRNSDESRLNLWKGRGAAAFFTTNSDIEVLHRTIFEVLGVTFASLFTHDLASRLIDLHYLMHALFD